MELIQPRTFPYLQPVPIRLPERVGMEQRSASRNAVLTGFGVTGELGGCRQIGSVRLTRNEVLAPGEHVDQPGPPPPLDQGQDGVVNRTASLVPTRQPPHREGPPKRIGA